MQGQRRPITRIFLVPGIIALVVAFGLISALLGDGVWDAASWIALGVPLVTVAVFMLRNRAV